VQIEAYYDLLLLQLHDITTIDFRDALPTIMQHGITNIAVMFDHSWGHPYEGENRFLLGWDRWETDIFGPPIDGADPEDIPWRVLGSLDFIHDIFEAVPGKEGEYRGTKRWFVDPDIRFYDGAMFSTLAPGEDKVLFKDAEYYYFEVDPFDETWEYRELDVEQGLSVFEFMRQAHCSHQVGVLARGPVENVEIVEFSDDSSTSHVHARIYRTARNEPDLEDQNIEAPDVEPEFESV
jgi:hypothetical protein